MSDDLGTRVVAECDSCTYLEECTIVSIDGATLYHCDDCRVPEDEDAS